MTLEHSPVSMEFGYNGCVHVCLRGVALVTVLTTFCLSPVTTLYANAQDRTIKTPKVLCDAPCTAGEMHVEYNGAGMHNGDDNNDANSEGKVASTDLGEVEPILLIEEFSSYDPPTVTLSASPNPVEEGETITATLSVDPSVDVVITAGTAESEDYYNLVTGSITISGTGSRTTGTFDIETVEDTDEDDETFTVALGDLPAGVVDAASGAITVTITDDDKPRFVFDPIEVLDFTEGTSQKFSVKLDG
ncbi:MAG: hypothetical protein OXD43_11410, partial [Bacteroidetes bacterium]|nr:hypothetical protein [Bacteroidota bacterium]